tara:strand:+ start:1420 stop:1755 length:336 start_codon:yes stop_codon:yes gene_type:complete
MTEHRPLVDALRKQVQDLEVKVLMLEKEVEDQDRREIPPRMDELWAWYRTLKDDDFGALLYDMKRITKAFEKDDLFNVIYGARSMQKYLAILATAFLTAVGVALWQMFVEK